MADNHATPIIPYLLYRDVRAALEFLDRAFGFEPYGDAVSGPDGNVCHAAMKLGEGVVMMGCYGAVDPEGHQWYFAQHTGRQ